MNTRRSLITVGDLTIEIMRKRIKRVYLRVYPPDGRVCVSVPQSYSQGVVRRIIAEKLEWIRRQQSRVLASPLEATLSMTEGEIRRYREQLRQLIPPLARKWEPMLGVQAAEWRIRRMKTRWGSCNFMARRIWLNLELARRSPACLEYVVVHELTHLLEPRHNARFYALLDAHLPQWRALRAELNAKRPPAGSEQSRSGRN
jgi:predicted metal-dependent hydrolase